MHKGIILSLNEICTELPGLLSVPFSVIVESWESCQERLETKQSEQVEKKLPPSPLVRLSLSLARNACPVVRQQP